MRERNKPWEREKQRKRERKRERGRERDEKKRRWQRKNIGKAALHVLDHKVSQHASVYM